MFEIKAPYGPFAWALVPSRPIRFAFGYCLFVLALVAAGEWAGLIH